MTAKDPTDQALAMIASIFETPTKPEARRSGEDAPAVVSGPRESDEIDREQIGAADVEEFAASDRDDDSAAGDETDDAVPDDVTSDEVPAADDVGSDEATDEAEANDVAPQAAVREGETLPPLAAGSVATVQIATTEIVEITFTAPETAAPIAPRVDGPEDLAALTRYGPGPLDALRFKWSVRQTGDDYFVDETIGTSSQPISSGPFSREEAIAFIDGRDRRTRRRFERLRNEIVSGPSERGVADDDDETL